VDRRIRFEAVVVQYSEIVMAVRVARRQRDRSISAAASSIRPYRKPTTPSRRSAPAYSGRHGKGASERLLGLVQPLGLLVFLGEADDFGQALNASKGRRWLNRRFRVRTCFIRTARVKTRPTRTGSAKQYRHSFAVRSRLSHPRLSRGAHNVRVASFGKSIIRDGRA
jgi:hypothetical protein